VPHVQIEGILDDNELQVRRAVAEVLARHAMDFVPQSPLIAEAIIRAIGRNTGTWTRVRRAYVRDRASARP